MKKNIVFIIIIIVLVSYIFSLKLKNLINVYNINILIKETFGENSDFKYDTQQQCKPAKHDLQNCNVYVFNDSNSNSNLYIIDNKDQNELILYNKNLHESNTLTIKKYMEKYFPDNVYLDYDFDNIDNTDFGVRLYDDLNKGDTWPVNFTLSLDKTSEQVFEDKIIEKLRSLSDELYNEESIYVHYNLDLILSDGSIIEHSSNREYISYNSRFSSAKTTDEFLQAIYNQN